jgi:hypothetical protein
VASRSDSAVATVGGVDGDRELQRAMLESPVMPTAAVSGRCLGASSAPFENSGDVLSDKLRRH